MERGRRPSFLPALVIYHAVNDGMLASLSAMFPVLAQMDRFDLTYESIGLLTSLGLTVTIIYQIIAGRIGDVRNPQHLMAGGVLLLGLSSILLTQAYDYITLLSIVLVIRVGSSFYHPVGIGWISKKFKGQALDRSMGYQSALGDAGVMVAFMSTGFIALNFGWRLPFIIWGVSNLVSVAIGMATKFEVQVPKKSRGQVSVDRKTLSKQYKRFSFALLPLAVTGAAYTITTNFGPLLVTDKLGMGADVAGLVLALWIGTGVISATLYGKISAAMGRKKILVISFLVMLVTSFVIGLTDQFWLVCAMMSLFGFFIFLTWPGMFAMISEATRKVGQGFTFGLIFACQIAGGASIAYVSGLAADIFGIGTPFLILGVMIVLPAITLMKYKDHN